MSWLKQQLYGKIFEEINRPDEEEVIEEVSMSEEHDPSSLSEALE